MLVKLNDSAGLAKFIRDCLPGVLEEMKQEHGWSLIPHVVVHDKASYMVNATVEQLNPVFVGALTEGGFRSWVGAPGASAKWMCSKFGDVYLHETVIAHIRRLLATQFSSQRIDKTASQFQQRLRAVQDHMNSQEFCAEGGGGLASLAKELRCRCKEVVKKKGARIPK